MTEHGFKRLSVANWLEPDPMLGYFVRLRPDGSTYQPTGDQRAEELLRPRLSERVPFEVERLFEVARGVLIYGYFFYPLFTFGAEQLFRVAEAAVSSKCLEINASRRVSKGKFEKQLEHLRAAGVISEASWARWDATRNLRNSASHPKDQTLFGPNDAAMFLEGIVELINALFAERERSEPALR